MKHLLIIAALMLVGCGGDQPRITGEYDVLVQESSRNMWLGEVFAREVTTKYRSVVDADTGRVYDFDHFGWLGEGGIDRRASIRLIYETDSTTYDTICFVRKECGE